MSISTATDDRTDGDDDTSQESQPKDDSSDSENENENINDSQNQNGGVQSPEVHEITSDDEEDCVVTNEDESSNSSGSSNGSTEGSQHSNKDTEHKNIQEEQLENGDEEESDIEEVTIEDPLNQVQEKNKPIVINDTKNLVELAKKQASSGDSKEPTVVIIDTNSILSGKGPVPVQNRHISNALEAQSLCQSIAARGTTITPVSCKVTSSNIAPAPQPNILPSLTDDMFVVEAPSFIVPYVYEKPSVKPFREFVDKLGKELEEIKLKEDQIKLEKERVEKERKEKERQERIAKGELVEDTEEAEAAQEKKEKKQKRPNPHDDDSSWDGESSDSENSGIHILKSKSDLGFQDPFNLSGKSVTGKVDSYFDCSLGQFFINIGLNLVQEFVQTDLVKQQSRKLYKEKKAGRSTEQTQAAIASLSQNLAHSRRLNAPLRLPLRRCEFCSFRSESRLALAHHLEAPHMRGNVYRCNLCPFEIRSPHDILYHMEAAHARRGRLERAPAYQQCANCHFEDNSKTKLARHLLACAKKFKPELNLAPPLEWEPPAKIPKVARARPPGYPPGGPRASLVGPGRPALPVAPALPRGRGRPPLSGISRGPTPALPIAGVPIVRGGVVIMHNAPGSGSNYPAPAPATPKISITPLPRAPQPSSSQSKTTFVICEICDGYIKDLEQLRNHMQWIHKVKIHPKMIYNRPPLNCQKCQFRFFTDQGLERHLLGSHGLVTSAMQEAANRGKDAGRCPACGRVYQWKLLAHVARDHGVALKPAHLSYKCTVCTATFGMYRQFESHVYSAHSVAQRRRPEPRAPPALPALPLAPPPPAQPAHAK